MRKTKLSHESKQKAPVRTDHRLRASSESVSLNDHIPVGTPNQQQILGLQRTYGNQAVMRLLNRSTDSSASKRFLNQPSSSPMTLQRMIWTYGSDGYWEKEKKDLIDEGADDTNRSQNPPNLPIKEEYNLGDSYDDALAEPTIYSSTNARTLGEPNRFKGYGTISPAENEMFRKGLAIAKLKLERSVEAVKAGAKASRSGGISAHLAEVLEVAFNMPTDLARTERLRVLEILETGLLRLQTGLSQDALALISSAHMYAYGIKKPADCSGWVPRGITETGGQGTPVEKGSDLKPVSGEIHMQTGLLSSPSFVADTIIHEGCHKFLGAWDYSYVGVQGSVGTGLNTKAQLLQDNDPLLSAQDARQQAKTNSSNLAFANLVKAIIANGLKTHLPEAMDRGRPLATTDSPNVQAAKTTWNIVRSWGTGTPPTPDAVLIAVEQLLTKDILAGSAKTELNKFKADKVKYLAEQGNALGVKGHEVLFALSTDYLLKNADSWTELALTAPG